jgi:hypothetical protein
LVAPYSRFTSILGSVEPKGAKPPSFVSDRATPMHKCRRSFQRTGCGPLRVQQLGGWSYALETLLYVVTALLFFLFFSPPTVSEKGGLSFPSLSPFMGANFLLLWSIPGAAVTVLIALTWVVAGRKAKSTLFEATGVLGFVGAALALALLPLLGALAPSVQYPRGPGPAIIESLSLIGLAGISGTIGIAYFVLMVVSIFSAAKVFGVKQFRYAGIMYLVTIVAIVLGAIGMAFAMFASIASALASAPLQGAAPDNANIVSAAFFKIPSEGAFSVSNEVPMPTNPSIPPPPSHMSFIGALVTFRAGRLRAMNPAGHSEPCFSSPTSGGG